MASHPQLRLSVPPRVPFPSSLPSPFPTPSKSKRRLSPSNSLPSLFLLLCSLRSLYSLLPFLRSSSASFSLFPFSFLVSLLSLVSTSLISYSPILPLPPSPLLPLLSLKSLLLALVFLLRFQALRSCGTAATILAEFSGALAARSASDPSADRPRRLIGSFSLLGSFLLLANGWDRIGCSPLSILSVADRDGCRRFAAMLLPFLSGFLGFLERSGGHWANLRQLGKKKVRIFCLAITTLMLFPPAVGSLLWGSRGSGDVSILGLWWPLVNTVVFGVVLGDNNGDEKGVGSGRDLQKEFLVIFSCTLVLELFYFPQMSLPGILFCGLLIWIAVKQFVCSSSYVELGGGIGSASLYSMVRNPIMHIVSERKSRKIALFLLINTAYMVVEFVVGFMSNSLGLISDACHMLFDCAALAIGLYASYISRLPANGQFNYGRGRVEVLSGYVNAVFLVLVGALIVLESLERILDPQDVSTNSLLSVSIGGLLVNVIGLIFFHEEHHHAHGGGGCCHSHSHPHTHTHPNPHPHLYPHLHLHDAHQFSQSETHSSPNCLNEHGTHDHSQISHCHSHDNVVHEHSSTMMHNNYSSHVNSHDHCHNDHSHHDHHHHHSDGHMVSHRELALPGNDRCHHQHDLNENHHHHHIVSEHEIACTGHFENERTLSTLSSNSHNGHTHEKIHDASGCCNHHDSMHFSVTTDAVHFHNSDTTELTSDPKAIVKNDKHHNIDHNMEGIFLHVLADTLGSVGVVISTLLIKYKGWLAADPACSIFISIMIISSVLPLLWNSAEILMQRVSRAHEQDLRTALDQVVVVKGVCGVQNVHVWNFTNNEIVGTIHLQISPGADMAFVNKQVSNILLGTGVKDLTIQMEYVKGQQ